MKVDAGLGVSLLYICAGHGWVAKYFTLIGHFLLWMIIAGGVAGYLQYQERGIKASEPAATRAMVG